MRLCVAEATCVPGPVGRIGLEGVVGWTGEAGSGVVGGVGSMIGGSGSWSGEVLGRSCMGAGVAGGGCNRR